jgi:hypothetical protein
VSPIQVEDIVQELEIAWAGLSSAIQLGDILLAAQNVAAQLTQSKPNLPLPVTVASLGAAAATHPRYHGDPAVATAPTNERISLQRTDTDAMVIALQKRLKGLLIQLMDADDRATAMHAVYIELVRVVGNE